ncbi:MAG: protein kinase, partial [Actinomycetota bacterium]|nr:protein kinase [Actinomycetota bacterium]
MGEVYRAHDPKINRDVAIKVLPASLSADPERLRRFEQEAQAAGALNHSNVLSIYDVETHDGTLFVVSELLEGETLREQMGGGALPPRKTLDYAQQIAKGLAAAHEHGIVHRDLKPENLFVTRDGQLKILDFGLAKLVEPANTLEAQTEVPTRKINTSPGVVLGTVGYMSPEQVRGARVDHRSDIFSFGCVLYEMLSGRRAFGGESVADTLSAILREEPPDLPTTDGQISPALERVVRHCMEKNPARRFQSAGDLAFALEALPGSALNSAPSIATPALPTKSRLRQRLPWLVTVVVLLLLALSLALPYFRRAPAEERVIKLSIPAEKEGFDSVAISPDGRLLAFTTGAEVSPGLYVRPLDSTTARLLPGTEGASFPFWSPDSRPFGFFTRGQLMRIEASGGPPTMLSEGGANRDGSWSKDGVILFAGGAKGKEIGGLYRVSAGGGEVEQVIARDPARAEDTYRSPSFLPDGRHFLYHIPSSRKETQGIYLGSLDGKTKQRLLPDESNVVYARPGYLLFMRGGALMAQAFDAERFSLSGQPAVVAERVGTDSEHRRGVFSVSDTGLLVLDASGGDRSGQLVWVSRSGVPLGLPSLPGAYKFSISPDGKRVVTEQLDPQTNTRDLWLYEVKGGDGSRFTFDPAMDIHAVWSGDGSRIVWSSFREGVYHLYQKEATGAGREELLFQSDRHKIATDWPLGRSFIL